MKSVGKTVLLNFDEVFENQFGASDFIAIAKKFSIIFVENWQVTKLSEKNKMRRIILFIDEVYNHKSKLFALSDNDIEGLFLKDDLGNSEEAFMVDRCVSRLNEIVSVKYMEKRHLSHGSSEL